MGKLMDFLMEHKAETVTTQVEISGFPHPFVVKSISEGENKQLSKSCQTVTYDKKTHQKTVEIDQSLYGNRLVAACCVEPNFKDAELQKHYGVVGAEELIDRMLKPGQYIQLAMAVQEVNGFSTDINELRDEAKN